MSKANVFERTFLAQSQFIPGTQDIFGCLEVNGEATEASASDNDIPA